MPKRKNKKDKRASQRIYYCMPAKYKLAKTKELRSAVACQDIGGGGLKLLVCEHLKPEEKLDVYLYPVGAGNSISASCRVVWCRECKDGNFNIGLEFIEIMDKEYFIEFLCDKILDFSLGKK